MTRTYWIKEACFWLGIVLAAIAVIGAIAYAAILPGERQTEKQFTKNCTLNKGVPVRDLAGDMRCVPTFFAIAVRHD